MRLNTDYLLKNIACFHRTSTDFLTGVNPPYHRHENMYEIYLFIKGNTKIYIEDYCYELSPGTLMIVRPNELHRSIITDHTPYERIGINITSDVINMLSSDRTGLIDCFSPDSASKSRIIRLSPSSLAEYVSLTDDFLEYNRTSFDYGNDLLAVSTMIKLLIFTNKLFYETGDAHCENVMPKLVVNVMKYIDEHLLETIALKDISRKINYSPNYISIQFKYHTGLTIREYILDKRIEAAKKQLLSGKSVSDACALSGFNDYSNFIRSFTKKVGISPGHYK